MKARRCRAIEEETIMAMLLKGAEVAKALTEELHAKTEKLKKNGVEPCLAILRVGAREDDLA